MNEQTELLQQIYQRVTKEYELFKVQVLAKEKEEIYERSYAIESYLNLYELLIEHLPQFTFEELEELEKYPDIIGCLYGGWLATKDSYMEELLKSIRATIGKYQEPAKKFSVILKLGGR